AAANAVGVVTLLMLGGLYLWRGPALRRYVQRVIVRIPWGSGIMRRAATAVGVTFSRLFLTALALVTALTLWLGFSGGAPAWTALLYGLFITFFAWRFGYTLVTTLFDPARPERRLVEIDDAVAAQLRRRVHLFIHWLAL